MTEIHSIQTSAVPSASDFTSSPLRNRVCLELDAPVVEVWELIGDLSRFPEYSVGLERVEAQLDEVGLGEQARKVVQQGSGDLSSLASRLAALP